MKLDGIICCAGWGIDPNSLKPLCMEILELFADFLDLPEDGRAPSCDMILVSPDDYQARLADMMLADSSKQYLGIGYSMGFACLAQLPIQWFGLVAISGFTRFCAHPGQSSGTPLRLLERMINVFEVNPLAVLKDFMLRAKVPFEYAQDVSDAQSKIACINSLKALMSLDMTKQISLVAYPLLVLSTMSDQIVSSSLIDDCFQNANAMMLRYDDGIAPIGHALPYMAKNWCVAKILDWMALHGKFMLNDTSSLMG